MKQVLVVLMVLFGMTGAVQAKERTCNERLEICLVEVCSGHAQFKRGSPIVCAAGCYIEHLACLGIEGSGDGKDDGAGQGGSDVEWPVTIFQRPEMHGVYYPPRDKQCDLGGERRGALCMLTEDIQANVNYTIHYGVAGPVFVIPW